MKKVLSLVCCAGVALAFAACGGDGNQDPPPLSVPSSPGGGTNAGTAHAAPGTTYIDQSLSDVANVQDDRVVFPASSYGALSAHKAGDILVSNRQGQGTPGNNPDGFLRRITSIAQAAEGTVVMTQPATLDEAFDELDMTTSIDPAELSLDGQITTDTTTAQTATIHPLGKKTKDIKLVDFSNKALFNENINATAADGSTVPVNIYAGIEKGTIAFSPGYDVSAKISGFSVQSLKVAAVGGLSAELSVRAGTKIAAPVDAAKAAEFAAKGLKKSYSKTLAQYKLGLGEVKVGPFGFPSSGTYTLTVNCDFNFTAPVEVVAGASAKGEVTVGFEYANKSMSPVFEKSLTLEAKPPTYTKEGFVRAQCNVTSQFDLKFFGVVTAGASVDAYGGMGGSNTCGGKSADGTTQALVHGDIEAGVSGKLYAKVDLFKLYKKSVECTLFDENAQAQYDTTYPYPGSPEQTCKVSGPYPLDPRPSANPSMCFSSDDDGTNPGAITGTCTHDVCVAGDKLGQQCDDCTMKVCAADPYCCDTFWGLSCFQSVEKYCGKKCGQ
ncbi:hypothetical protein AKJ09_00380 [Labilithrix luteola]|uniref:Lipoprotein n=1 Tax=Labilithrix luteola TaxID=1391654 RepID=A0A0K1PK03_9BACT|nr:hypothetical protein [Labilithrix luteola]AKU93716.1 hypothetical protein AKJ09_00380 [Labilithrix luteola]